MAAKATKKRVYVVTDENGYDSKYFTEPTDVLEYVKDNYDEYGNFVEIEIYEFVRTEEAKLQFVADLS